MGQKVLLAGLMAGLLLLVGCSNPFGTEEPAAESTVQQNGQSSLENVPLLTDKGDHFLLGDDIILNKNDVEHQSIIASLNESSTQLAKTSAMQYVCIPVWPKGVVTYSLTGFSTAEKKTIQEAMATISKVAKVTYTLTTANKPYIYKISKITSATIGGQSTIGYTSTAYCQLNSINTSTCVHEFMHGLGFGHEHQRSDRDKYVTINTANILNGYASQFQKVELQTAYKTMTYTKDKVTTSTSYVPYSKLVTGYDYASIMHYPKNAFAKSSKLVTIEAKGNIIGTTLVLSTNDKTGLIAIYGKK